MLDLFILTSIPINQFLFRQCVLRMDTSKIPIHATLLFTSKVLYLVIFTSIVIFLIVCGDKINVDLAQQLSIPFFCNFYQP